MTDRLPLAPGSMWEGGAIIENDELAKLREAATKLCDALMSMRNGKISPTASVRLAALVSLLPKEDKKDV